MTLEEQHNITFPMNNFSVANNNGITNDNHDGINIETNGSRIAQIPSWRIAQDKEDVFETDQDLY